MSEPTRLYLNAMGVDSTNTFQPGSYHHAELEVFQDDAPVRAYFYVNGQEEEGPCATQDYKNRAEAIDGAPRYCQGLDEDVSKAEGVQILLNAFACELTTQASDNPASVDIAASIVDATDSKEVSRMARVLGNLPKLLDFADITITPKQAAALLHARELTTP